MAHGPARSKSATRRDGRGDPYGASHVEESNGTGEQLPPISLFGVLAATGSAETTGAGLGLPLA